MKLWILLVLIYLGIGVYIALKLDVEYKSITTIFWILIIFVSLGVEVFYMAKEIIDDRD